MEELRDLSIIANEAIKRLQHYKGEDFILPESFKADVTKINNDKIEYNKYSAIIVTNKGLRIFMPNQWIYIASYFTDLYKELIKYKEYSLKVTSAKRLQKLKKESENLNSSEVNNLNGLDLPESSKKNLRKFIHNYKWWGGAKTIDRTDFYVSPILSFASLVNASQAYVADLCAFLANKEVLVEAILSAAEAAEAAAEERLHVFVSRTSDIIYQKIYYGAPGTGKSNEIKKLTGNGTFGKNYTFRITFHPDSDYSSFVGAYKPVWDDVNNKIKYEFRPQTFLKAYIAAWTNPKENVALVIEEINRGNCAQIFGDIFQLLDREGNGLSKYPIEADVDMQSFLDKSLERISEEDAEDINEYYSKHYDNAFKKIKNGEILALPKNLNILATMNTSDQSLFPMDSAFKRRWDWEYMPIVNEEKGWGIKIGEGYKLVDWGKFLNRINMVIADLTTSEDKQLGYYFCMPDKKVGGSDAKTIISAERFVGKVIFYLWNDVFKNYAFDAPCCKDERGKEVLYAEFYEEDGKNVNIEVLKRFLNLLSDPDDSEPLVKEASPTEPDGATDSENTDSGTVDE